MTHALECSRDPVAVVAQLAAEPAFLPSVYPVDGLPIGVGLIGRTFASAGPAFVCDV